MELFCTRQTEKMNTIDKLLTPLVFLTFVILYAYYLFYYPFAFNYLLNENGQYFAAFVALCCWFVSMLLFVFSKKKPGVRQSLSMLLVNVFILCLLFCRYYSFANEYFTNITVVILLCTLLMWTGIRVAHFLLIVLGIMFFWQLCLAFEQMGGFALNIQKLNIQGTLQNSGVFSFYLVAQLPFLYYLFFSMTGLFPGMKQPIMPKRLVQLLKGIKCIVFAVVVGFVVFIVWQSQSRTALLALIVLLLYFFILHYGKTIKAVILKLPKVLILTAAGVLLAALGYMAWNLFNLKKLSALGRLMALDTATDHLTDHFWLGTGIGRFTWYYPQWQAQYFAMHSAPSRDYFLSAGESYILFNEYVQLFHTIGLPGFIIVALLLTGFFAAKSIRHADLLNAAKLTATGILVCGLSSYPLHVNCMLMLLALCFAIAAVVNETRYAWFKMPGQLSNAPARLLPAILIIPAAIVACRAFGLWQAKQELDTLRNQLNASRTGLNGEYIRLMEPFKYNGKFLTEYGIFLSEDSADCVKASIILEEAKKYFISRITIETLAEAYRKSGNQKKAIENYEWLCHYLPNKFGTKVELLKLFHETKDTLNARAIAHTILTMPVKIPSTEVDKLKAEAETILNHLP
ncbi:hypothetical protein A3860_21515 [Niastella vici]|uniref:O-antigen ligase-related domain-containing protein n=1 Tax=Niastella vici TaxID=1703345 RepID=A0A1V9G096_9BACT|nr:O-antigen ligase family protein [Niastella vici]OQP64002.1 hypothetical protein A3860_21515 [Niastella vici]